MKNIRFIGLFLVLAFSLSAQKTTRQYWQTFEMQADRSQKDLMLGELPETFQLKQLDISALKVELEKASLATASTKNQNPLLIQIPNPEGGLDAFYVFENTVVAPEVAHLYTVKTFEGYAQDDPTIPIRCDISETGFHAVVFKGSNTYAIEPLYKGDNSRHIVFNKKDINGGQLVKCAFEASEREGDTWDRRGDMEFRNPANLRTFKLAYVTSGEYSQQFGGAPYSTTNVLNSLASAVNVVNAIYMADLGVKFILVTNTALIFPNPGTDPFNPNDQVAMLEQNVIECDNALGNGGYDVGHLLMWANTGGLASGGVVCWDPYKAEGFSGNNSSFTTLIVDYSCHEIGHQFYAPHNFASTECQNSEINFRFEPGEGSSIMSYAGVCGAPASYQGYSNQYFHSASLAEMNYYIDTWGGCETNSTPGAGNASAPSVNANANITIPKQTPFILVGSATDGNDPAGQLTYLWEQYDGAGPAVSGPPNCSSGNAPLFKFEDPVADNFKILPDWSEILNGNNNGVTWQKLPCAARTLNFNLIVRDNNANWGRTGQDGMVITVANTGPFAVSYPNGGELWSGNSTQTVTWNVNGTSGHCANVDILVSTDGGASFTSVATNVANDGVQDITVPNTSTSTARVLVQCSVGGTFKAASTFFDVSNANFIINQVLPVELIFFNARKANSNEVELIWSTATEINASHFEIEKSMDGNHFFLLEKVGAKGNSFELENYHAMDGQPFYGVNYYRLKQVDFNGDYKYSDIIDLYFEGKGDNIILYPNPAKDMIMITGINGESIDEVVIFNKLGQRVLQQKTENNALDISSLSSGVYFLETTLNQRLMRKKLVIRY